MLPQCDAAAADDITIRCRYFSWLDFVSYFVKNWRTVYFRIKLLQHCAEILGWEIIGCEFLCEK